jgi:hypothetical protein
MVAVRASVAAPLPKASRAERTAVRVPVRVILLRTRLRLLERTRLMAEAVLAKGLSPN